jgi:hypothetical protein
LAYTLGAYTLTFIVPEALTALSVFFDGELVGTINLPSEAPTEA